MDYKDIPGFPGYKARDDGTIFSAWLAAGNGRSSKIGQGLRQIKAMRDKDNRLQVRLSKDGKKYNLYVSRLILLTFVGQCPPGMECCHNDGNTLNNKLENLRWDFPVNNMADKIIHGTLAKGEYNGNSKLTNAKVQEIRTLFEGGGWIRKQLANLFKVNKSCIERVINRTTYKE